MARSTQAVAPPRGMLPRRIPEKLSILLLFSVISPSAGQDAADGQETSAFAFPPPAWNDPTFGANGVSVSRKHDLCNLWRSVYVDKTVEVRDALRNQTLSTMWPTVAEYELEGLHYTDTNGALTDKGLMTEIFAELSRRAGFNWRRAYGFFEPPATSPATRNKTWTDILYWTAQNYDVSIGWYPDLTAHKSKGYLFPEHWFDSSLIMVTKGKFVELPIMERAFSFLRPFTLELWTLVMVSWVFAGAVYWFLEQGGLNSHEFSYPTNWQNMCLSITYTALEWGGGKWHHPHTFAGRIFTFVWLFVRLLFISMYTAHLASSFVSNTLTEYPVTSLSQAIEKRYPICIEAASEPLKVISALYRGVKLVPVHERDIFANMEQGKCVAAILPLGEWRLQKGISRFNVDCRFHYVGRPIRSMRSGFALAENNATCTSLASTVLDIHLQDMVMEGFVEDAWLRYLDFMHDQTCVEEENANASEAMGIVQTGGLFLGLVIGAIVSILLSCSPSPSCSLGGRPKTGPGPSNKGDAGSSSESGESEDEEDTESTRRSKEASSNEGERTENKSSASTLRGLRSASPQIFSHLPPEIALELQKVSDSLQILSRSSAVSPATAPAGGGVGAWDFGEGSATGAHGGSFRLQKKSLSVGPTGSAPDVQAPWGSRTSKGSAATNARRQSKQSKTSGSASPSDMSAHGKDKTGYGQSAAGRPARHESAKTSRSPSTRDGNGLWQQPIEPRADQAQLARSQQRSLSPSSNRPNTIAHQLEEDFVLRERQLEAASRQLHGVGADSEESEVAVYRVKAMLQTISKELEQARDGSFDLSPRPLASPTSRRGRVVQAPGGPRERNSAQASKWENYS